MRGKGKQKNRQRQHSWLLETLIGDTFAIIDNERPSWYMHVGELTFCKRFYIPTYLMALVPARLMRRKDELKARLLSTPCTRSFTKHSHAMSMTRQSSPHLSSNQALAGGGGSAAFIGYIGLGAA